MKSTVFRTSPYTSRALRSVCAPSVAALLSLGLGASCSDSDSDDTPAGGAGTGNMPAAGAGGMGMAGSGMTSAGAGGTGMGGGGMVGVVSDPCPASAVFCDDFEDGTVGSFPSAKWNESTNGADVSIQVDATRAVSGNNAVLVSVPGGSAYRRAYLGLSAANAPDVFPAVATEMYGRAMMWLDATPDSEVHWTFIQGEGASGAETAHTTQYRYGGQQQGGAGLMANYETSPQSALLTDCWDHSAATMPTQEWACVEWRFAQETNEMEFWLNGVNLEDIHVTDEGEGCIGDALQDQWVAPPAFETLYLGWERYQEAANDRNLWMDDIVVSTERVGCAQ